jgi:hypothetical protein
MSNEYDALVKGTSTVNEFLVTLIKGLAERGEESAVLDVDIPIGGKKLHVTFDLTITSISESPGTGARV